MARQKTKSLGTLLREARGDRSLRQAARQLGISDPMYKQWERDYAIPGAERATAIAEFIGIPRADVLCMLGIITREEAAKLRELDESATISGSSTIPG